MKIIAVLYNNPMNGYPKTYARDSIPKIECYPDSQTPPTPKQVDFQPRQLLGCVSGELELNKFIENLVLIITSDKDGLNCILKKELPDADIVISQSFWLAYLTKKESVKHESLNDR